MIRIARSRTALLFGLAFAAACGRRDASADSSAPVVSTADTASAVQTSATRDSAGGAVGGMSAANIVSMLAATDGAEIVAARVAERKATGGDVKVFARQMIHDHEAIQKSVDSLTKAQNIVPQPPPQEEQMLQRHRATMTMLDSLRGHAFDVSYADAQVQAHQRALDDLRRFSSQAQDPDLKALIDRTIPTIQQHLERAKQLQAQVTTGAATGQAGTR